jgi:hypothetical protein
MEQGDQSHSIEEQERFNEWAPASGWFCWEISSIVVSRRVEIRCIEPPPLGCASVAQSHSIDILADFAHQLRQLLSTLDALAFYLDLIANPEDAQMHDHLQRIHAEIAHTDQVLRDGLCTLRAYFSSQGCSVLADVPPGAAEGWLVPSIGG